MRLLRAPISQQLIINPDSSFPVEATIGEWFRGSFCNQSECISVILFQEHWQGPPSLPLQPALLPVQMLAFSLPSQCLTLPQLACFALSLVGCGCSSPTPELALPPPGHQARGGAGLSRPALAVERARGVLLPVILTRDFYLGAVGRREEETPGVALIAGDTFLGLYKLSTWDG